MRNMKSSDVISFVPVAHLKIHLLKIALTKVTLLARKHQLHRAASRAALLDTRAPDFYRHASFRLYPHLKRRSIRITSNNFATGWPCISKDLFKPLRNKVKFRNE